jgi:hypothetical protein
MTMGPRAAVLVLVASVVLVGAVGYAVLSVVASESTNTATSSGCTPAASPACGGHSHTSDSNPGELVAYHDAR